MRKILAIGLCLLFSSGAYAQTVAPSGQTPLARMQEDEVSGSAHQAIENAKKQSNGKTEQKSAEEKSTSAAQKRQREERKDKAKRDAPIKNGDSPQP
ncbi:MAG: hypothetical protein ABF893_16200 [Gluconacetobacter liquefaciens]